MEDLTPLGAAWARGSGARGLGADVWAEVFCGPAATGGWVHADPVLGWLDMCAARARAFACLPDRLEWGCCGGGSCCWAGVP